MTYRAEDLSGQEITGRELPALLAPVEPATFLAEYWQLKPLHVPGCPDKFRLCFDRDRFNSALIHASGLRRTTFRINSMRTGAQDHEGEALEPVRPNEVAGALARGLSICVNDIGEGDARLARVGRSIKAALGYAGAVRFNAYLSPHAAGAGMHFDARVATTLQIEGRKRWRFSSSPAVAWPRSNAVVDNHGVPRWVLPWAGDEEWERAAFERCDDVEFDEVTLEPGDILCLPAGTWHSASAIGSSLALNLTFEPLSFSGFVQTLLDYQFRPNPSWRSGPPPSELHGGGPDTMPESVRSYLRERLREARAFFADLEKNDMALERVWRRFVVGVGPGRQAGEPRAASPATAAPEPNDELAVVHDRPISYFTYRTPPGEPALCFLHGSLEIDVSGQPAIDFFRRLAHARQFVAASAVRWTDDATVNDWPEVQQVLHLLMQRGVLVRCGRDAGLASCC